MVRYISILFIFLFQPIRTQSLYWVKTDNGCEYLTHHVDASKIKWDGECLDGKVHGEGTVIVYKNDTLLYEYKGIIQNGALKIGEMFWASGKKYVGEWKDSKLNGKGILNWGGKWTGQKYVGEFKDSKRHGQGTLTLVNGSKYVVEFEDDKMHGQGIAFNNINRVIKSETGIWVDGVFKKKIKKKIVKKYLDEKYPGYPKNEEEMEKYLAERSLPKFPKPKMPPNLALKIEFKEPSGNNYLDAEETGEIQIKIINNGIGEAYGMETTVSITETVGGLLLEDLFEKIKTDKINPAEFAIINKKVSAHESISSGKITFEINVTEFNGFDLYPPGKLVIETKALIPPDLQLVDIGINDLTNYNGRIDPNEVVEAKAIIQNKGQGTAKGVTVLVVYGDNVYNAGIAKSSFSLGDMEANETKEIDFSFFANRKASNDLPIKISIKEQRGKYDRTLPADLALNKVIKKATEVIVAGKDEGLITITDASILSIDIEKNIPNTRMKNKNGFAVVIGNREYSGDVPDVEFAVRDAEYVKEYLIQTLGYRPGNIFYYTNATLSNMKVAFNQLKNAVKPNKSDVFVYYSGHGAPDPDSKQGYFVPVDANPNHIAISGYPVDDLYAILNQTGARSTTVVIDACFSGSSDQGMILKDISPVFIEVDDSFLTIDNSAVFTSATGKQVSSWYRDQKHSLFTYYFLKALHGDADANTDKKLTLSEIKDYIDENVPYMARRLNNREQTPQLITDDQTKIMVTY